MKDVNATAAAAVPLLEQASNLITGPRNEDYGDFKDQMEALSDAFNGVKGREVLTPQDIGILLILLKMRRLETGWTRDSAVDICGYASLMGAAFTKE